MMKSSKRQLAILLLASCLIPSAIGCGGSGESEIVGKGQVIPPAMTPEEQAEYDKQMIEMSKD